MAFAALLLCRFELVLKRKWLSNQKGCSNPLLTLCVCALPSSLHPGSKGRRKDRQPDSACKCAVQTHVRDCGARTWDCTTCTTSIFTITSGVRRIGTHNSSLRDGAFRGGSSVDLRILPGGKLGAGVNILRMRARTHASQSGASLLAPAFVPPCL